MKKVNLNILVAVYVLIMALAGPAGAVTHYVSEGQSIQAAIDASSNGDKIEVAPATYNEAINFNGKAVRLYSSGGPEVTIIDANGLAWDYHVVQCVSGEGPNTILEGFTITGGDANGYIPANFGGGMFNYGSSPTVTNCTFSGNSADYGGGMCNWDESSPTITNCNFSGNTTDGDGGGMCNAGGGTTANVTNCTFSDNISGRDGGGMFNGGFYGIVAHCTFINNDATRYGGGMSNDWGSPAVTNCKFINNEAGTSGGGMFCSKSSPSVTNCTFIGNEATTQDGGGIANDAYIGASNPNVTNCLFIENTAGDKGGGISNGYGNPTVTNCTFSGNSAGYGGGIRCYRGSAIVTNCVLWGDTAPSGPEISVYAGDTTVMYCDVQGSWPGLGNINADPLFVDAAGGDLRLSSYASPCVDAGDNGALPFDSADLDGDGNTVEQIPYDLLGNPRIFNGDSSGLPEVDMGAFELSQVHNVTQDLYYSTIQCAIDDASNGDKIEVAPGTYNETIDFLGKPITLRSTDPNDADIVAATVIDGTGYYHVVECSQMEGPNTILEGFTITGGHANGPADKDKRGGGMHCENSNPTVTNCTFAGNSAEWEGGGMYNNGGSPTVTNCTFSGNTGHYGGGMRNYDSDPNVSNCTFSGNSAGFNGGGMCNYNRSPTVTNCNFSSNSAPYGGGMYNDYSSPKVTNCTFSSNSAGSNGGGMCNSNSSPTVTNCTFSGNAPRGMSNYSNSNPEVTNCILWGDTPDEIYNLASTTAVSYSDVQGGYGGTGNIDADPCFVDADSGDLRLLSSFSPCVDTGDNGALPFDTADLDGDGNTVEQIPFDLLGNPRVRDGDKDANAVVDMGAFEFNPRLHNITRDCWYEDIQPAIGDASEGDELVLEPGTFYEAIDFAEKGVTLRSTDPNDPNIVEATIIDATGLNLPVVTCASGEGPDTVLAGVTLTGGSSSGDGGGMYNYGSSPTVTHCVIRDNSAEYGGGMYNIAASPTAIDCIFRDNSAREGGGMYNFDGSSPIVTNCTFTANTAGEGCGMYNLDSSPIVTNCILWGNWGGTADEIYDSNSTASVSYCDVQGGYTGGNINAYPMFVNPGAGDLHLGWGSECIDAGSNSAPALPGKDMEGRLRILDGNEDGSAVADMGVYEYDTVMPSALMQVSISPAEAITDGVQWRLDRAGPWFASGEVVSVLPGYHEVEFAALTGWSEPETISVSYEDDPNSAGPQDLSVRVIGDMATYVTAEYKPLAVINVGEIPPWDAPHDSTVEFYIDANWMADPCFQIVDVNGEPVGDCSIDPYSGLFTYEPNEVNDRTPFTITFRVSSDGDVNEQTVEITPVPQLPPEFAIVSAPSQPFPDVNSWDYIVVNEILSDANEVLNGRERQVRSITIAGKKIVVSDGLVSVYSDADEIRDMTIYAESLVVDEPLNLPQTNVTIYARELHFAGEVVDINTTPIDQRIDTGEPNDGLRGGDISLYIESFDPGSGGYPRLKVEGTAGLNGGRPGYGGAVMSTLHTPQPLAWLSPYALKMVIAHAKDAYLYGYAEEAKDILEEYQALVSMHLSLYDPCSVNPVYELEDPNWIPELRQMHDEISTLIHRIENGLDYFGNPPNWVPMLSFEVTRAFFEQEIGRTIPILYLSYWIQNRASDKQTKANELIMAREKLWNEFEDFRTSYSSINNLMPELKVTAGSISDQIGDILSDLQRKEQDLLQRAQDNVEEHHKLPMWQKSIKSIATIATYTCLGASKSGKAGAALGAAGGVCSVVNDLISEPDPWAEVYSKTDVVQQFNSIDFDQAAGASLDQFNSIQEGDIETDGAAGYLQNLRASSAQIADGMSAVKDALKETVLDNAEVEAELRKIKATDPTFNKLVDKVTELMAEKEVMNRQLAAAMQETSTLSNEITNNILSIDAMNRQASNSVIDPRAAIYAREMELRARNRLLKYHYYMAKAYEYRMLEPYRENLNIESVYDQMRLFVDDPNHNLTSDDWDALKSIYDDLLADITYVIHEDFQNNYNAEYTKEDVTLTLSSEEIARLNAELPVTINFMERESFLLDEESIRIADLYIEEDDIDIHVEGPNSPDDYFDLRIYHSGFSKLQYEQNINGFVHHKYNTGPEEPPPVNWNHHVKADGTVTQINRSDASASLLWSLLNLWGTPSDIIMKYTRPAAWADIVITKVPRPSNVGDIVIDSLTITLDYDHTYQSSRKDLHVLTSPGDLQPYIVVDTEDVSGRQDGRGDFYRRYTTGQNVVLTAPSDYGDWQFVRWALGYGPSYSYNPVLSLSLTDDTKAEAQYVYVGPVVSVADFNGDLRVDMRDFSLLAGAWLTVPQDDEWEGACDIGTPADYYIDWYDLEALCIEWLAEN